MSGDVLAQYQKERLLELKQIVARVSYLSKKFATRNKTKPLGSQRVGFESKQIGVIWFKHLVLLSGMRKCWSQHVLLHLEK
jgi:hypothetical protein